MSICKAVRSQQRLRWGATLRAQAAPSNAHAGLHYECHHEIMQGRRRASPQAREPRCSTRAAPGLSTSAPGNRLHEQPPVKLLEWANDHLQVLICTFASGGSIGMQHGSQPAHVASCWAPEGPDATVTGDEQQNATRFSYPASRSRRRCCAAGAAAATGSATTYHSR